MMKVYMLICLMTLFSHNFLFGQTNTFPSTGNVGIGTTSPSHKLDLNGSFRSNSNILAANPNNIQATSFLGWKDNVARIRVGGNGDGAGGGFDIQTLGDKSLMRLLNNGNVGIGTTNPISKFDVVGTTYLRSAPTHNSEAEQLRLGRSDSDIRYHSIYSNHTGIASSNFLQFRVHSGGDSPFLDQQTVLTLYGNGNVGIGIVLPTHKLEVNGSIRAKEVKLEATNWPDYVFQNDFELMPLEVVKSYIDQNGHLPGLKPAKDYEQEGVNVLEMNQKLLEKVEELTLYVIQLKDEIITLKQK
ncbi:hypothetical protein MM239_19010 [Belliella sp. DSM 111904]|uniref:Chaperone of endosialidase n=1 Tax=Belliella filtrata TaxID=2923435 RepID=A0ABS9V4Z9_9BACT|nr:hypothetical protein [Belliella filtrata]MCH7411486.1 hypothetical protein [Belliella filtrata]